MRYYTILSQLLLFVALIMAVIILIFPSISLYILEKAGVIVSLFSVAIASLSVITAVNAYSIAKENFNDSIAQRKHSRNEMLRKSARFGMLVQKEWYYFKFDWRKSRTTSVEELALSLGVKTDVRTLFQNYPTDMRGDIHLLIDLPPAIIRDALIYNQELNAGFIYDLGCILQWIRNELFTKFRIEQWVSDYDIDECLGHIQFSFQRLNFPLPQLPVLESSGYKRKELLKFTLQCSLILETESYPDELEKIEIRFPGVDDVDHYCNQPYYLFPQHYLHKL